MTARTEQDGRVAPPPPDARAMDTLRELHGLAVEAGYEDPIFGALVIASMALADLEGRVAIDLRRVAHGSCD